MTPYEKAFSVNIRKYRKKLGLTQKMLAEATGYSEKTVSKWETDGCIPAVNALFRIASVFHIDLNALFQSNETIYYLGIDGGGVKTTFALANHTGEIIRKLYLDSCNPFDVGIHVTKNVLKDGIYQICQGIPFSSIVLFAGIAGSKVSSYYDSLHTFLQEFHFASANVGSDNENIIAAGLENRDGITVILGTGICSYVVKNNQHHRIAGWGYLFDKGGGGYNIAREALCEYFSACDGSGEPTSLTAAFEESCGCDASALLNLLYEGGKRTIASYAGLVFQEAEKGDAVSCAILRHNMAEAARIILAAKKHFSGDGNPVPVILAGGLTEQPLLLPYLQEALGDLNGLQLEILSVESVEGAVKKAMSLWREEINR